MTNPATHCPAGHADLIYIAPRVAECAVCGAEWDPTTDDLVIADEYGPTTDADYAEEILDARNAELERLSAEADLAGEMELYR